MSDKSSFLKSESLASRGLEGGLKAFKSFLKDKKENQEQNQRLWHSLRSCLFEKQRQKQKHQYIARRHSLNTVVCEQKKAKAKA